MLVDPPRRLTIVAREHRVLFYTDYGVRALNASTVAWSIIREIIGEPHKVREFDYLAVDFHRTYYHYVTVNEDPERCDSDALIDALHRIGTAHVILDVRPIETIDCAADDYGFERCYDTYPRIEYEIVYAPGRSAKGRVEVWRFRGSEAEEVALKAIERARELRSLAHRGVSYALASIIEEAPGGAVVNLGATYLQIGRRLSLSILSKPKIYDEYGKLCLDLARQGLRGRQIVSALAMLLTTSSDE